MAVDTGNKYFFSINGKGLHCTFCLQAYVFTFCLCCVQKTPAKKKIPAVKKAAAASFKGGNEHHDKAICKCCICSKIRRKSGCNNFYVLAFNLALYFV